MNQRGFDRLTFLGSGIREGCNEELIIDHIFSCERTLKVTKYPKEMNQHKYPEM